VIAGGFFLALAALLVMRVNDRAEVTS
jgi:hypothetical protein